MQKNVIASFHKVKSLVTQATQRTPWKQHCDLVAASKVKPVEAIQALYDVGHRHFGESYVQEFVEKAPLLPLDIKWHFIGHIQSNKVKMLLQVPNLRVIETVDSIKLANRLNNECVKSESRTLEIMIQVNTSGEQQKSGIHPDECISLVEHVISSCPNLNFVGLMTIGKKNDIEGEAFQSLVQCRKVIADKIGKNELDLKLSMGMSADFEKAIGYGSTNVRIGSTIFGERDYSKK